MTTNRTGTRNRWSTGSGLADFVLYLILIAFAVGFLYVLNALTRG